MRTAATAPTMHTSRAGFRDFASAASALTTACRNPREIAI
jgi:hypothetical protein